MVALLACGLTYATDFTLHEGENKINVNDFVVNATYTAKSTGKVIVDAFVVFDKVECNGTTYSYDYTPGAQHGAYHYEVNAEAGQVISIVSSFFLNNGTSIWISENGAGPVPVSIQQVSPARDQTYSWAHAGMMTINFNKSVVFDRAYLVAGGKKYAIDEASVGSSIGCKLKDVIEKAQEEGSMKTGDRFIVRFEGVREMADPTNLYNGNGILEIAYLAPAPQGRMVSAKADGQDIHASILNSYTILSYYDTDGEEGLLKFEFSKNIKSILRPRLRMGDLDRSAEGLYYEGDVPYSIDGKVLTIDLRGELRSYARLFPGVDLEAMEVSGTQPFTTISLALVNIIDEDGNPMATEQDGNVGSFAFTFNYKELEDNIVMDGDRSEDAEGSMKAAGDVVQLWIDQELKSIDGVSVFFKVVDDGQGVDDEGNPVYVDGKTELPLTDISILSSDPIDGCVIGFTIPQLQSQVELGGPVIPAADGQPLRIVIKVRTANGMPHDMAINYIFRSTEDGITTEDGISRITPTAVRNAASYGIDGLPVSGKSARGIVIIGGKKYMK